MSTRAGTGIARRTPFNWAPRMPSPTAEGRVGLNMVTGSRTQYRMNTGGRGRGDASQSEAAAEYMRRVDSVDAAQARYEVAEHAYQQSLIDYQDARREVARAHSEEERAEAEDALAYYQDELDAAEAEREEAQFALEGANRTGEDTYARAVAASGQIGVLYSRPEAENRVRQTLGNEATPETLARFVGAEPGDVVNVSVHGEGGFGISAKTARGEAEMGVQRLSTREAAALRNAGMPANEGELVVTEPVIRSSGKTSDSGVALIRSFAALRDLGVGKIYALAARGQTWNGYDTWAKLGATGPIPRELLSSAQARFGGGVTRVEQVMDSPGGSAWWKEHGTSWRATMDLTPGGRTRTKLDALEAAMNRRQRRKDTST